MEVSLILNDILDIDEVKSELTVILDTELQWRDPRLTFLYLKSDSEKNLVDSDAGIWQPVVLYHNMKESIFSEDGRLTVRKEGNMTTNAAAEIVMEERYEGAENTISLVRNTQVGS